MDASLVCVMCRRVVGNFCRGNKLCKITEVNNYTIPSYKINNLNEKYNEALLKKTELTLKETDSVMKKKTNLN